MVTNICQLNHSKDAIFAHPGTGAEQQGFPAKLGPVDTENLRGGSSHLPKCSGIMRVIFFIEDPDVIKKIKHLGRWDMKQKPRPTANAPPIDVFPVYDEQPGTVASAHWEKNKKW